MSSRVPIAVASRSLSSSPAQRLRHLSVSHLIAAAETARADFDRGVVRITIDEFDTALAVAAGRARK